MNRSRIFGALMIAAFAAALAACSGSHTGSSVPSLSSAGGPRTAATGAPAGGATKSADSRPRVGYSTGRVAELHAAAQCIREHGVPSYQDPVLTADGFVYTDARSIQDAGAKASNEQQDALYGAMRAACGHLLAVAGFQPEDESPAPPQLVQAGVRSAQCLRAHGLPGMHDPTSSTQFTPGHGFGLTADELPDNGRLGKQDPTLQHAFTACRSLLDAEIRASSLSDLAHD